MAATSANKLFDSIIYTNYAPYGNAGNILDYLIAACTDLIYVSFVFHPVSKSERNRLEIYHKGSMVAQKFMPTFRVPKKHVHRLTPILSVLSSIELIIAVIYGSIKIKPKHAVFFSPNAFLVNVGILLRRLSLVNKVIFWIWDYYPTDHSEMLRRILNGMYWVLDKRATKQADYDWYISARLLELREQRGVNLSEKRHIIAPLGIDVIGHELPPSMTTIGFLGVLKRGQGLELLFDSLDKLVETIPHVKIEIIGSGPDEDRFISKAAASRHGHVISFRGFVEDEDEVKRTVASWSVALALYTPSPDNLSIYADPAKVRLYLGCGVPVIMTDVPLLAGEVAREGAGKIVAYNSQELISGIVELLDDNQRFRQKSLHMATRYEYRKLYGMVFEKIARNLWPDAGSSADKDNKRSNVTDKNT